MKKLTFCLLLLSFCLAGCNEAAVGNYKVSGDKIMTRWAKDITPANVHREYPRPQMVRSDWSNLNGLWDYAITSRNAGQPETWDGQILVPFAIESALSGVGKTVGKDNVLWYKRTFSLPWGWNKKKVLLHFGAVDWDSTLWVNGKEIGSHKGGYDPFYFDITDALTSGKQQIVLRVWDPTNDGTQPRGKQVKNPHGIWYTSVTGIWQTVWAEAVNDSYIKSMIITPDIDKQTINIKIDAEGKGLKYSVKVMGHKKDYTVTSSDNSLTVILDNPKLWSPDNPYLYDMTVSIIKNGKLIDKVDSYFGMRKIEIAKDKDGINRLCLNNEPLFQYGPLDQGWWPDGLYTAPCDEALRYDVEITKELGFNMMRKHVKVEPARLYYWCDKLGLLVWQDMPSGDRYIRSNDPDIMRTQESSDQFYAELKAMIDAFRNHPSIVMWVPFNEGWGQFDTEKVVKWIKDYDPEKLVNNASGWTDRKVGDVHDIHRYPGPGCPKLEENRAAVLGEFGGLGLPIAGHTWQDEKNWGYRSYKNSEELTAAYENLISRLRLLIGQGLTAAVYTQTTDVEIEVNGLLTYDRAVIKMDKDRVAAVNNRLYLPAPIVKTIIPAANTQKTDWKYTTATPPAGWEKAGFDDSGWKTGKSGFGTQGTPGTYIGTEWNTTDIWLRKEITLPADKLNDPHILLHHDEDAQIYINGRLAMKVADYTTDYINIPLSGEAAKLLRPGKNVIAVHCSQSTGGQYIDLGITDLAEKK